MQAGAKANASKIKQYTENSKRGTGSAQAPQQSCDLHDQAKAWRRQERENLSIASGCLSPYSRQQYVGEFHKCNFDPLCHVCLIASGIHHSESIHLPTEPMLQEQVPENSICCGRPSLRFNAFGWKLLPKQHILDAYFKQTSAK